jgi:uncharacterized membrane protein YkoI
VATIQTVYQEKQISIEQVPALVQATILAQANGGTVGEIEMETANGRTIYEADVTINGQEVEIKVAPDGTLVAKNAEDEEDDDRDEAEEADDDDDKHEEQVSLAETPEAVKATILKETAGTEIKEIEKEAEDGRTIYSAEAIINGQKVDFEIAPDGTLLGKEVENEDDDN